MDNPRQHLRIAAYNIEWFNALFDEGNNLLLTNDWSARYNVTKSQQANAIAYVLSHIDADIIAIIEAPDNSPADQKPAVRSTVDALENFATHFKLRQSKAMIGFPSDTHQEIAFLYDPERTDLLHTPHGRSFDPTGLNSDKLANAANKIRTGNWRAPRFDSVFPHDITETGQINMHVFSKPPLEALLKDKYTGQTIQMIAVHAKSKSTAKADTPEDKIALALENRRKQLAQCTWLRLRADSHIEDNDDLIILGDFNDGPGLDKFEQIYGKSGVEVTMGDNAQKLRNPYVKPGAKGMAPVTARFYKKDKGIYENALLDFIMLSANLADRTNAKWQIWHPFNTRTCHDCADTHKALLTASDHFPITVDLF